MSSFKLASRSTALHCFIKIPPPLPPPTGAATVICITCNIIVSKRPPHNHHRVVLQRVNTDLKDGEQFDVKGQGGATGDRSGAAVAVAARTTTSFKGKQSGATFSRSSAVVGDRRGSTHPRAGGMVSWAFSPTPMSCRPSVQPPILWAMIQDSV